MLPPNIQPPKLQETDLLRADEQEEISTARTNFTETVKAKIFARDKGICAFSGLNLWLLDEGACGFYNTEWIDHIIPATKGGTSVEENGVATHWAYNYNKSNNMGGNIYLFLGGAPTYLYWEYHRRLTPQIALALANNQLMHYSDWYFNRAIASLLKGVVWLDAGQHAGYKRDDSYHARTAIKRLEAWKRIVQAEPVESLSERGLVPEPLTDDQKLLLSIQDKTSVEEIKQLMREILPHHRANLDLKLAFDEAYPRWLDGDNAAFDRVIDKSENPMVNEMVAQDVLWNIRLLCDPFMESNAEEGESEGKDGNEAAGEA